MKDLANQKYGYLTPIKPIGRNKNGYAIWLCKCECGNECQVAYPYLIRGNTKSCGCYRRKTSSEKMKKLHKPIHGLHGTRLYNIYNGMKARCYNPKSHKYKNYGGRGVTICNDWLGKNGFINFKNWAFANGYQNNLTIDRINVNGNYEPDNCRWADITTQENNRTNNTIYEFKGIKHTQKEWADILGCHRSTINRSLKRGLSFEEIVLKYMSGARVIELLKGE